VALGRVAQTGGGGRRDGAARQRRPAVVTLDALGTLVELEHPVPRLAAELRARGVHVGEAQAALALRAEIVYYRAHHDVAADAPSLALLRDRCARVLGVALGDAGADVGALTVCELRDALLAALRFRPFDDVPAALAQLRAAGHRLVVVSNWDVSLHEMLRTTGLDALVDGAISSAEAGERKPAPGIFRRALKLAGGAADGGRPALHVGDSLELDVAGALGAGLRAVLVARAGAPDGVPRGVPVLATLDGLAALAA
jgi:putative hydrolase of the HAD superfamily